MDGCGRPATVVLAEPNDEFPGLWTMLPVCTECQARLNASQKRQLDQPQAPGVSGIAILH